MHLANDPHNVALGFLGILWLAGLWSAAPVLGARATLSGRLVSMLALGTLVPLVLAFLGVFFWWSCWLLLAALVAFRFRYAGRAAAGDDRPSEPLWDLAIAAIVLLALAWPVAVRPVMDGDTINYHLPNATNWVTHHGIWTTDTRYWWYPPASELFAAALLAVAGVGVVGWAALVPAALVVACARETAMRFGYRPVVGTMVACALLATPVAAAQIVSVRNDLWLAALFVSAMVEYSAAGIAILALTKPVGFAFALVAVFTRRAGRRNIAIGLSIVVFAIGFWIVRDIALARSAIVPIGSTAYPNAFGTTILGNAPQSLAVLVRSSWNEGPAWTALFLAAIASIAFFRKREFGIAAAFAFATFLCIPTGYAFGNVEHLASGDSLRYSLPFVALGTLFLLGLRVPTWALLVTAAAGTLAGIVTQWGLFSNDSTTHDTPIIVAFATAIALAMLFTPSMRVRRVVAFASVAILGSWGAGLARNHPADYVRDRFGGAAVYAAHEARPIVTLGLPAGAVTIINPNVRVIDGLDFSTCAQAKALDADIATTVVRLPSIGCGRIVYRDATTAVVATN